MLGSDSGVYELKPRERCRTIELRVERKFSGEEEAVIYSAGEEIKWRGRSRTRESGQLGRGTEGIAYTKTLRWYGLGGAEENERPMKWTCSSGRNVRSSGPGQCYLMD